MFAQSSGRKRKLRYAPKSTLSHGPRLRPLMSQNSLTGIRVMVTDDSNTIRRSAEITLKQAGCEVILAEDGFDALAKIVDHRPDIIFLDVMMPRLDGYTTCAMIKRNAQFRDTPVVMLSSKDSIFDQARGKLVGANEYLTKPFTKDSLLGTVARHARSESSPSNQEKTHAD